MTLPLTDPADADPAEAGSELDGERGGAAARSHGRDPIPVALVERARDGSPDAFGKIYEMLVDGVGRYVAAIVREPDHIEDVVAQTFLRGWRGLPRLRHAERFEPWLFRIAHNEAMNELRRRPTLPIRVGAEPHDARRDGSPPERFEAESEQALVQHALTRLPPDQREVLVLRFLRELPHSEVARLLGRSEQATRALQYRALRRMVAIIDEA